MRPYNSLILVPLTIFVAICDLQAQWIPTDGPPGGGWVTSFARMRDTLYAAEVSTGLYGSLDRGISWQLMSSPAFTSPIHLVVQGDSLVAGSSLSNSLYETTDQGSSWSKMTSVPSYNPGIFTLFTDSTGLYAATSSGLYRYSSGSSNWSLLIGTNAILSVYDYHGIIFAGTELHGVLYSTDRGSTWTTSDSGLITNSAQLAFGSIGDSVLFAGTSLGLFFSTDTGRTWTQIDRKLVQGSVHAVATYGKCIVAGSDSGVFFSQDGGRTWEKRTDGMKMPFVSSLIWDSGTLSCGTGAWIYTSADSGRNWILANGAPDLSYIAATAFYSGTLFASVLYGRTYQSTDNGDVWEVTDGIPDSVSVSSFGSSPSYLFACTEKGLFKLRSGDTVWGSVDTSSILTGKYSLTALSDMILFVENSGRVYRSEDGGSHWTESDSGLPNDLILNSMAVDGGKMFLTTSGGLYSSSDSGASWQEVMVVDSSQQPGFGSVVILSRDSVIIGGLGSYYSQDGGTSWIFASDQMMNDLLLVRNYLVGLGYISLAPYLSSDLGRNWTAISYNFNDALDPTSLYSNDNDVFMGTRSRGVWRLPVSYLDSVLSGVVATQLPVSFILYQNFPNPFNPSTIISYQLPSDCFVTLKIYDVLGREVKTLVNKRESEGPHSITFNAGRLPSGAYFYRIQAGNYTAIKKLMLVK